MHFWILGCESLHRLTGSTHSVSRCHRVFQKTVILNFECCESMDRLTDFWQLLTAIFLSVQKSHSRYKWLVFNSKWSQTSNQGYLEYLLTSKLIKEQEDKRKQRESSRESFKAQILPTSHFKRESSRKAKSLKWKPSSFNYQAIKGSIKAFQWGDISRSPQELQRYLFCSLRVHSCTLSFYLCLHSCG